MTSNAPDMEDDMGNAFGFTLLFKPSARKEEEKNPVAKIGIKTGLVICAENETIPTYTINIHCVLKYKRYYTDKRSLKRVNLFAEKSSTNVTSN